MTYLEELKNRYKEARKRMEAKAIEKPRRAIVLPPPMPKPETGQRASAENLGLISEKADNELICAAMKVTSVDYLNPHSQLYRMAEELMNSPRLPPIPGLVLNETGAVRWMRIMRAVAKMHGVELSELMGESRKRYVINARCEIFYRLRIDLAMSYSRIGRIFRKDHTTIMHGVNKVRQKLLDEIRRQADDDFPLVENHSVHGGPHSDNLSAA